MYSLDINEQLRPRSRTLMISIYGHDASSFEQY